LIQVSFTVSELLAVLIFLHSKQPFRPARMYIGT